MGSYSFFLSHHLQTMEGGMIVTDDDELMQIMRAARAHGWIRDMPNENKWYRKSMILSKNLLYLLFQGIVYDHSR